MSETTENFDVMQQRVLAEFATQGFGSKPLSFKEAMELREYAKARTDLHSDKLTMEQAIWKSLYDGLTEECHGSSPGLMTEIESLEKRQDDLENLQAKMAAKMKAHPHDYGIRA